MAKNNFLLLPLQKIVMESLFILINAKSSFWVCSLQHSLNICEAVDFQKFPKGGDCR